MTGLSGAEGAALDPLTGDFLFSTFGGGSRVIEVRGFAVPKSRLTVTKDGTGTGRVTSAPAGIDCGATCSAEFANGSVVSLTPTPDAGSLFDGWSGACTGTGACSVTMDAAKSVTATFAGPVSFRPTHLTFSRQKVDTLSDPKTLTVRNNTTVEVEVIAVAPTGPQADDFWVETDTCSLAPVPPNGMCTVSVSFAPLAAGNRDAALTVTSDAPGSPHAAPLSGIGGVPGVSLSPTSLSFGPQAVDTVSPPQTVTVRNTGDAALEVLFVDVAGTHPFDFTVTADGCSATVVAPNGTCAVNVSFTPTVAGPRSGTLTVDSDAPGTPHTAALSGSGTAGVTTLQAPPATKRPAPRPQR
jgi:hypothetical protein